MADYEAWVGDCHLQNIEENGEYSCQAAIWADSYERFRAQLAAYVASNGLKILWLEECLPAIEYLRRHAKQQQRIGKLTRAVHPQNLVELSRLVAVGIEEDETPDSHLTIEEIKDIEPLDFQFGIHPRKTVPDRLYEALFGQPEATETELARYGGVEAVPPMRTYAILDAAKMPYLLTGHIKGSGLTSQSLFQGETAEEIKEHSPYLVELTEDNGFTAKLLTGPKGVNGLWEKELGIYIRSRAEFAEVRKHFRKFTRVQDNKGSWYYFAFWQPMLMHMYCDRKKHDANFIGNFVPEGHIISFDITLSKALIMKRNEDFEFDRNYLLKFSSEDFQHMRRHKISHDSRVMGKDIWNGDGNWSSQAGLALAESIERIEVAITSAKANGFSKQDHIAKFVSLCERMNETIRQDSKHTAINQTLSENQADGRKLTNLEYDVKDILEGQQVHG